MPAEHGSDVTYVTVADARFFPGTVALTNSLRLTGNEGNIVVVDAGLTSAQLRVLSTACHVHTLPPGAEDRPAYFKAAACVLGLNGVLVFVDSDIIVTSSLDPILANAREGVICAFVDEPVRSRYRPEWEPTLGLRASPRRQPYLNSGFVALDANVWDAFLHRWLELCQFVRNDVRPTRFDWTDPFGLPDQDVLNALLMSEVPREAIHILDQCAATPGFAATTRIADRRGLRCVTEGRPTTLLHYWDHPKPWFPEKRTPLTLGFPAYVDLLPRVLLADDLTIRLDAHEVPVWLRPGVGGALGRAPCRARSAVGSALPHLPRPVQRLCRRSGGAVARRLGLL